MNIKVEVDVVDERKIKACRRRDRRQNTTRT